MSLGHGLVVFDRGPPEVLESQSIDLSADCRAHVWTSSFVNIGEDGTKRHKGVCQKKPPLRNLTKALSFVSLTLLHKRSICLTSGNLLEENLYR